MARAVPLGPVAGVVGLLAFVELTSGILQGFYTPLYTDIARFLGVHDADVNWLEGAQLAVSAVVVPVFAKLGDIVGHRRMLLWSTAITALASLALAATDQFGLFLLAWAVQGFYVVWLPLEIALIYSRSRERGAPAALTRRAAGLLIAALELGAILGALAAGALEGALPLQLVLLFPAGATVVCFLVVLLGVPSMPPIARGARFDTGGTVLVTVALLALTGGLSLLRLDGPGSVLAWLVLVVGVALFVPFGLYERRRTDPLVDVRMFRDPSLWPVFVTAGLFGVSVLGAQAPLSTFARTDPAVYGYGLGASSGQTSILVGVYVLSLVVGAMLFPLVTRWLAPRLALVGASALVALGYLLFVPLHEGYTQVLLNMLIAGIGSGALVAALPATAAAAAPTDRTGVATGLTNSVKTVGGAIASSVFGIALLGRAGADASAQAGTAGAFSGYLTVWLLCGLTAVVAAVLLLFVPRRAFGDPPAGRGLSRGAASVR